MWEKSYVLHNSSKVSHFFYFIHREKHIPCSAAPPILMTNPIKEDNLIRNLPACFDIDCSCKDNQL